MINQQNVFCPKCHNIPQTCRCSHEQKKEWVGLTDEEILEEYRQSYGDDGNLTDVYFARAIESKLKEKNNG